MKKTSKKKLFFRVISYYLLFVLVSSGIFVSYTVLYRGKTEPKTDAVYTNTDAALYTLKQFSDIACQNPIIEEYAFSDNTDHLNWDTYIIPGLKATRTLDFGQTGQAALCMRIASEMMTTVRSLAFFKLRA